MTILVVPPQPQLSLKPREVLGLLLLVTALFPSLPLPHLEDTRVYSPEHLRLPCAPLQNLFLSPTAGFKPTFGPAWVPLYGSLPSGRLRDGLQSLNEGIGEGIWFRGRLLVAVSMEVLEGRVEPKSPQTTQRSRLSRLTGKKKKKKAKQDQIPAAVVQPVDASASGDAPEIPSAMEVEMEELLPLPEVGVIGDDPQLWACKSPSEH